MVVCWPALPNEALVLLRVAAPLALTRGNTFERSSFRFASASPMSARERSTVLLTLRARFSASESVRRVVPVASGAGAAVVAGGGGGGDCGAVCAKAADAAAAINRKRPFFNGHSV